MTDALDDVILSEGLPEPHLKSGDIGPVVRVHVGGKGYEVEFVALHDHTPAVVWAYASQIRPAKSRDVPYTRSVEYSGQHGITIRCFTGRRPPEPG